MSAAKLSPAEVKAARREFRAPAGLAEQLPADFRGSLWMERNFRCPSGLQDPDQVDVCWRVAHEGEIALNGFMRFFEPGEHRSPVRSILRPQNRLAICLHVEPSAAIAAPSSPKPLTCDVWLEITAAPPNNSEPPVDEVWLDITRIARIEGET